MVARFAPVKESATRRRLSSRLERVNRRTALRVYAAAAALVGVALIVFGAPRSWHAMSGKAWDGQQEWWCAHFWWKGLDPYAPSSLPLINIGVLGHPPTTSFYALPLAWFDLSLMGRLLGCAVIALLFTQLLITARELRLPSPPATALAVFGLVWVSPFFLYHLGVAQVSELIGFCYFLAWYRLRRDKQVQAGVALGLACTLKLYPAALVFFLLLGRRWRGVMAAGVTWLAVAALMTSRFGFIAWREYAAGEKQVVDWWIGHASNVTLQGLVVRALHPACVADTFADPLATRIATALCRCCCWRSCGCCRAARCAKKRPSICRSRCSSSGRCWPIFFIGSTTT